MLQSTGDLIFFQGFTCQSNGEWEWSGRNNNWLSGSSLTMVIISQPKSTGSWLIRDTSVLLFTIHLELFSCGTQFIQTFRSLVSRRALVHYSSFSLTSQNQREKDAKPVDQKGLNSLTTSFKSFGSRHLCNCIRLWPSIFRGSPSHHSPAVGSCFPAAEGANPQTREREMSRCHVSSVNSSDSTCPE